MVFNWASAGLRRFRDQRETLQRLFGIAVAVFVLIGGIIASPPSGLEPDGQIVLSVFLFAVILWLTKGVPYVVSSILSVTALFAFGVVDTFAAAVTGFASTLVFFLFLLLVLGNTVSKVNLDAHVSRRLLSAQSTPTGTVRSLSLYLFGLALLVPSAIARTVTFIPIVRKLRDVYGLNRGSDFEKSSFLVLGHVNALASMMLMTGGGMAITTSQIINTNTEPISWVGWAIYLIPPVAFLYWVSAMIAIHGLSINDSITVTTSSDTSALSKSVESGNIDPLSKDQKIVGIVMGGAVVMWIVGSFVGLPSIIPAVLAVSVLALPGIGVIESDDLTEVSWGILFLIGAMFSILDAMETSGALEYVVTSGMSFVPFATMANWQIVATMLGIAVFTRLWFSTASAAIVVVLPVLLEFANVLGINQLYISFSILLLIGSTTFFPFNTTSVLVSFDQGPLTLREVFLFGTATMVVSLVTITLAWTLYWPMVP